MKKFSGVGVALVTPFDETGRVDEHSLRNLVNYVIDGGVDYLVALGTTSEAATMTADERAFRRASDCRRECRTFADCFGNRGK